MRATKICAGILTIVAGLAVASQAQSYLTNGLVAYFPFTGNTADQSGNGHNGTAFGAATLGVDRFGNTNSCLSLPGTAGIASGVDIPSLASLPYLSVTYSAWFLVKNYPPYPAGINVMTLVGREACGVQNDGALCLHSDSDYDLTNQLCYFTGAGGFVSVLAPPTNTWCQVVLTVASNGATTMYLNGTNLPGTGSATSGVSEAFRIGASGSSGSGCGYQYVWNGRIDDVRVYNRVLSGTEVQELYAYESVFETCSNVIPATAVAVETNGFVIGATLTDNGCGYTNAPAVLIVGGGGSGATATATVANGQVTGVTITDAGIGYTNTPNIYIFAPLAITAQPGSALVNSCQPAAFSVAANGAVPLTYQWSFNGSNILGATKTSLTFSNVAQTNLGTYAVTVTDPFSSITSSNALLEMYPTLITSFAGAVTYWGKSADFSVTAWGTDVSIQWYDNGVAISGATNQTLDFANIQITNAGLYTVVVSNQFGSVTNKPEEVVVNPAGVSLGLYPGVTISGVTGYTYIIQTTTNLSDTNSWVTLTNLTLTQPVQIYVDTNIDASLPANPHRFYQVLPGQ